MSINVRVIVIKSAGSVFCAGHDLKELASFSEEQRRLTFQICSATMLRLSELSKPVIAQVHGLATAAGCQLVAAADIAIASNEARFATPGVNIGLFCSTPMVALSRCVGRKAALRMLLTGEEVDAQAALAMGLVSGVVAPQQLAGEVSRIATLLAQKSSYTLAFGKSVFNQQVGKSASAAYHQCSEDMVVNMAHADAIEGMAAFIEKRAARWST